MGTVLQGGLIVTANARNSVLDSADLRIEGTGIAAIGAKGELARPGDTVIDCAGAILMPGLVNVHTHAATWMFRGLAEDKPASFWAPSFRVPGQERFGIEDYKLSLRAACAELLLNGVTCIADRLGNMDQLAPIIQESGLRAVVGHTISDNAGPADWRTAERVIEMFGTDPAARVFAGFAPHALDSCSDALLRECAARASRQGCLVFIHAAQSAVEIAALVQRGFSGALDCLQKTGLTGPHVVAAHGTYLTEAELEAWPAAGISIAHCPASNLKIEARTLAIHKLLGKVAIGLGTDWTASNNSLDMLAEARLAALVGKLLAGDPTELDAVTMLRLMTIDGARVLGLDALTGSIERGKRADILVLDASRLELSPLHDPIANIVHSASVRAVRDVFVDGQLLVRNGRLTRASEAELAAQAQRFVGL
jgi:5-methylthioadenosine/S-adenosylhomocysteine deaminase